MKQPNWKLPVILSVTLLGAGNFAYWLKYSHAPKQEKEESLTKKPLAIASADAQIAMFKIKNIRGLIEVKCESLTEKKCSIGSLGKWTITNPTGKNGELYLADPSTIKECLP